MRFWLLLILAISQVWAGLRTDKSDLDFCNDNNACTSATYCYNGVCGFGFNKVCSASDSCHTAGTCDTVTGICSDPSKADGVNCGSNNQCNIYSCQSGVRTANPVVVCTAAD
jgi:hypothetical protein